MNKILIVLSYLLITIQFLAILFLSMVLKNTNIRLDEIKKDNEKIRQELIETENKCERMTDACIHILSEGAWE